MEKHLFTSESVTEGHPDKMCDAISDAVLDALMEQDPMSRVACETCTTTGLVLVMGEITTNAYVDIQKIVRDTVREIGYTKSEYGFDANTCGVMVALDEQSADIAMGVDKALEAKEEEKVSAEHKMTEAQLDAIGAGDQGMMFGFATNETEEYMPYAISLAHKLVRQLTKVRKDGTLPYLRPDGKSQVTVEYDENEKPVRLEAVVLSTQHDADVTQEQIHEDIKKHVFDPILPAEMIDDETKSAILLINSYDDSEVGSLITTNYICIKQNLTIRQAMHELVKQAGENDNIGTIYVVDDKNRFCGAIDLKDLIVARENVPLDSIISYAYPYLLDHEKISESIEKIKDYAEDSLPVLNKDRRIIGIITAQDVVEAVDDELGEDYAKLAGLTAEEDLKETTLQSMKKRMPWLIILLFLGMIVSSVVGIFENVVAALPIVICFQSLVLDMAGNVGTQSLAVTIRVLMDENLSGKQKLLLVVKEVRIGLVNGGLLGIMALVFLGIYVHLFKGYTWFGAFAVSGCVGVSLLVAMAISSLVGTVIPMFFHKIKIDPAVASGPLITTVNDLVAVVTYYGLAFLFLIEL